LKIKRFLDVSTVQTRHLAILAVALAVAACKGGGPEASKDKNAAAKGPPLIVSTEDVATIRNNALASGPVITGTIQPERRADVRAELSATVVQVYRENGDAVKHGDLLVKLDDTAIRDAQLAAEANSRNASQALEQATRQLERMKTLRESGMASAQALDDAEIRRNSAQNDVEAAKARLVLARQGLDRTQVRAPFDGVVSERKVSAGDTASPGKELLKVIDPASMRFEGLVSADHVGIVKAGQPVTFRVNGYGDQDFQGKVRRVDPSANPTTRQVAVLVDFVGKEQPKLAGLYAEGRPETQTRVSLMIPPSAVVREGDKVSAFRVGGNKLHKVALKLGDRDARSGDFPVASGLAEGDRVLRYPTVLLKDGQPVQASAGASIASSEARK
jgi:RND family efflux transporter MFP subunit